ncbi:MAG TPA: glycoside hydrolase family 28 protein [Bacteroidota bacterium]|nr:glycoside hydrolase family 28 protein [Bacteroidota bacterium]
MFKYFLTVLSIALLLNASLRAQAVFNVRDFGALGDGKTLDSPAINKTIEACFQKGGGTVDVPAGTYLSGSIHLKSNINLFLDAGATILGAPQELNAYDPPEPFEGRAYQDGGHTYFHNSLLWGENLENVSITGYGMINGGGLTRKDKEVGGGPIVLGDKAVALKECRHVLIRDITIFHGGHFAILVTGCKNLTIDNVTIDTDRDGIDLDCVQSATVSNCRINSPNDDGLCPKSSFALGRRMITENVTIVNCQVSGYEEGTLLDGTMRPSRSKTGRIKFGTESNGGFRNITVSNCTFRDCRGLALEEVDGGIMENISISNITMMNVCGYPIYITLGKRNRGPDSLTMGIARNIFISDVIATGVDSMSGVHITGMPDDPIENVRLQNILISFKGGGTKEDADRVPPELGKGYPEPSKIGITPAYGVFARHVTGLELADMNLMVEREDFRPPIVCVDVNGLEIDNFKAHVAPGVRPSRFEDVKGLVARNSPVLQ